MDIQRIRSIRAFGHETFRDERLLLHPDRAARREPSVSSVFQFQESSVYDPKKRALLSAIGYMIRMARRSIRL